MNKEDTYNYIYKQLLQCFPEKPWEKVITKLGNNPPIHKLAENIISFGLHLYETKKLIECDEYDRNSVADALCYCNLLMGFYYNLDNNKREPFKARWNAAFDVASDMRALLFEIFVYSYFQFFSWNVESKDDQTSGETYDFLARKKNKEIQVECKSFAYDKGLLINALEAKDLASEILTRCSIKNLNPKKELHIVTVHICKKLSENPDAISEICAHIDSGQDFSNDRFSVSFKRHNDVDDISEDISSILPVKSEHIELQCLVSYPRDNNSRYCLRITTAESNSFWREFEKICNDAAKKQLKKDKPAVLTIHISNIESIESILKDARLMGKINNIFNHPHIVSIIFISNTSIYHQDEHPYFLFQPYIKEFKNNKSPFKIPEDIFTNGK
ncbi:hypothetical protein ACXHVK_002809 [Morganella morganii]